MSAVEQLAYWASVALNEDFIQREAIYALIGGQEFPNGALNQVLKVEASEAAAGPAASFMGGEGLLTEAFHLALKLDAA
jgi:hypothetical protein